MATTNLIRNYNLSTLDDENYTLKFSMPDNCTYNQQGAGGKFIIFINLKEGHMTTSDKFIDVTEDYKVYQGELAVDFDQPTEDGKRERRPRIKINA